MRKVQLLLFLQQITYTTKDQRCRPLPKLETSIISFEKRPGCGDSDYEKSYQVNIVVPPVEPTCTSSQIIKVQFLIRVS